MKNYYNNENMERSWQDYVKSSQSKNDKKPLLTETIVHLIDDTLFRNLDEICTMYELRPQIIIQIFQMLQEVDNNNRETIVDILLNQLTTDQKKEMGEAYKDVLNQIAEICCEEYKVYEKYKIANIVAEPKNKVDLKKFRTSIVREINHHVKDELELLIDNLRRTFENESSSSDQSLHVNATSNKHEGKLR